MIGSKTEFTPSEVGYDVSRISRLNEFFEDRIRIIRNG